MKSEYENLLKGLIYNLEAMLKMDLSAEDNRHKCADLLLRAYYNMSSVEEKELGTWIMNAGGKLDGLIPLEKEDPLYEQEIYDYREELVHVIEDLKNIAKQESNRVEETNKTNQKIKI